MSRLFYAVAAISLFSLNSMVFAGPADDAGAHFKAIAAGNVEQVMQGYADTASLQWVGGPLDGVYAGTDKLREIWGKFAKANAPLEVNVSKVEESANPKGATVTANVEFKGKASIKVRYVLVYREGKLVNEVWQIDPKLAAVY
jgi:hypothetical protein